MPKKVTKENRDDYLRARRLQRHEKEKSIIPSDDQLIFYGYKEPLKKYKEGFGYMGVVSYSKERDRVQCHICGRLFLNVGCHAKFAHGLLAQDYKKKVGLALKTALVGEGTREKLMKAHDQIGSFSCKNLTKKQRIEKMRKMSRLAKNKGRHGWSLEKRNETGNCPEQLVDKIKKLQIKIGKRPSAKDYQKEYGSFQSVITVYGKWNEALRVAGMTTYTDEKDIRGDENYLLEQMRFFYKKYGRTPRQSDGQRGLIPCHQLYWKKFGSMNKARELAGIPVLIPISKYRYEEVLLNKK